MKKKSDLKYSPLTEMVYIVNGRGEKHDVTSGFLQIMMQWATEGEGEEFADGEGKDSYTKVIEVNEKPLFEVTVRRIK